MPGPMPAASPASYTMLFGAPSAEAVSGKGLAPTPGLPTGIVSSLRGGPHIMSLFLLSSRRAAQSITGTGGEVLDADVRLIPHDPCLLQ